MHALHVALFVQLTQSALQAKSTVSTRACDCEYNRPTQNKTYACIDRHSYPRRTPMGTQQRSCPGVRTPLRYTRCMCYYCCMPNTRACRLQRKNINVSFVIASLHTPSQPLTSFHTHSLRRQTDLKTSITKNTPKKIPLHWPDTASAYNPVGHAATQLSFDAYLRFVHELHVLLLTHAMQSALHPVTHINQPQ